MTNDQNTTRNKDRDFQYTNERLNDRESPVATDDSGSPDEEVLKNYPREPIHKDIMDEEQVNSVQERVRADHQATTNSSPASGKE